MNIGMSIPQFLERTRIALDGVKKDPKAMTLLEPYNLTPVAIDAYITVFNTANEAENTQQEMHERQKHENALYWSRVKDARATFSELFDLMQTAYEGTNHPILTLGKEVKRQTVALRWMQKANDFYLKVQSEPEILAKASEFNVTPEKLTDARQMITLTEATKAEHDRLKGEAQAGIRIRDKALEALYLKMKGFIRICRRYAFKEYPQYLEKLGINVLSDGYKRKAKAPEEPLEPGDPGLPDGDAEPAE